MAEAVDGTGQGEGQEDGGKMKEVWKQREKLSAQEGGKLKQKASRRIYLLVSRCHLYGPLEKPLEQVTDEEFLSCYGVGPKSLKEIRKVIPAPEAKRGCG